MPKGPQSQKHKTPTGDKRPSANAISRWENEGGATKKPPRTSPDETASRAISAVREAPNQEEVGDTADKITRAPKAKT
jgi:hypothetical protein